MHTPRGLDDCVVSRKLRSESVRSGMKTWLYKCMVLTFRHSLPEGSGTVSRGMLTEELAVRVDEGKNRAGMEVT